MSRLCCREAEPNRELTAGCQARFAANAPAACSPTGLFCTEMSEGLWRLWGKGLGSLLPAPWLSSPLGGATGLLRPANIPSGPPVLLQYPLAFPVHHPCRQGQTMAQL